MTLGGTQGSDTAPSTHIQQSLMKSKAQEFYSWLLYT